MGDDGTTIGTYFNADEQADVLADFDERFESRSESVKDAMRLFLAADDAIDATGYDFDSEQSKRMFVRQAILDQFRREQAEDSA